MLMNFVSKMKDVDFGAGQPSVAGVCDLYRFFIFKWWLFNRKSWFSLWKWWFLPWKWWFCDRRELEHAPGRADVLMGTDRYVFDAVRRLMRWCLLCIYTCRRLIDAVCIVYTCRRLIGLSLIVGLRTSSSCGRSSNWGRCQSMHAYLLPSIVYTTEATICTWFWV